MKTKNQSLYILILIGCAWLSASVSAQENRSNDSSQRSKTKQQEQSATTPTQKIRVTRATNFLGSDVIATDGRKVGDIVDYYLNLGTSPRLHYVVITTGGFLDLGGDRRAVPASAVSMSDGNCRINISIDRFWDVPVLPQDQDRFLADTQNRNRLSQFFTQADVKDAAGSPKANSGASDSERVATGERTGDNQRSQQSSLISFNALRNADAYGKQDNRLGYFVDAWINVNDNRAPYVEITPTFQSFRTNYDRRYAIPTAKLDNDREFYGYDVDVTVEELQQAKAVSEKEGVKMIEEGRIGNTVLRVTVAQK